MLAKRGKDRSPTHTNQNHSLPAEKIHTSVGHNAAGANSLDSSVERLANLHRGGQIEAPHLDWVNRPAA